MSGPLQPSPAAGGFSRRSLLLGTLAGAAVLVTGCTGDPVERADAVTPAQVDQLAAQVQVQETLVGDYQRAVTAAPDLAAATSGLADQARAQLDRLREAAPGAGASSSPAGGPASGGPAAGSPPSGSPASGSPADPLPDAAGAREWLRTRVAGAADAHATACPSFSGARAALLGSIAAGLRGQAAVLS